MKLTVNIEEKKFYENMFEENIVQPFLKKYNLKREDIQIEYDFSKTKENEYKIKIKNILITAEIDITMTTNYEIHC